MVSASYSHSSQGTVNRSNKAAADLIHVRPLLLTSGEEGAILSIGFIST